MTHDPPCGSTSAGIPSVPQSYVPPSARLHLLDNQMTFWILEEKHLLNLSLLTLCPYFYFYRQKRKLSKAKRWCPCNLLELTLEFFLANVALFQRFPPRALSTVCQSHLVTIDGKQHGRAPADQSVPVAVPH